MIIANTRVLISYEGQPPTCYGCNEQGHQFQDCPCRKQPDTRQEETQNPSWADVVTKGTRRPPLDFKRPTDPPSCSTHGEGMAELTNTSQPKPETSMASARTEDEDAEMDTQTQTGTITNNRLAAVHSLPARKRMITHWSRTQRPETQRPLRTPLNKTPIMWI